MGVYQSEPGVDPVKIVTFQQLRSAHRRGRPLPSNVPELYSDFFHEPTAPPTR